MNWTTGRSRECDDKRLNGSENIPYTDSNHPREQKIVPGAVILGVVFLSIPQITVFLFPITFSLEGVELLSLS
jgi:hypothetical protein